MEQPEPAYNIPYGRNTGDATVPTAQGTPSPLRIDIEEDANTNSELLSAWMLRLQTLTVVTTFLVSMDSQMFSLTAAESSLSRNTSQTTQQVVHTCLSGALVFHLCAAITAYIASFALIRYRIVDASPEDVHPGIDSRKTSPLGAWNLSAQPSPKKIVLESIRPREGALVVFRALRPNQNMGIGSRSSPPPLSLLKHCYYTTLCQTAMGFILALTGFLSYSWAGFSVQVGGFSTVCLGIGLGTGLWAITS